MSLFNISSALWGEPTNPLRTQECSIGPTFWKVFFLQGWNGEKKKDTFTDCD